MGNAVSKTYDEVDDGGIPYRFYRIKCYKTNKTYIGKTIHPLDVRLNKHITKSNFYNSSLNIDETTGKLLEQNCGSYGIVYKTIRGIDYDIELIKEHILCDNLEARITEQIYLDEERLINIGNVSNIKDAYITKENSRIKKNKATRDKYKNDPEYREQVKDYSTDYNKTHRENINKRSGERVVCELCGGEYTRSNKWKHNKTFNHKSKIN